MQKINIVTIYVRNYGAILQACALRLFIAKSLPNSNVQILDFYSDSVYHLFQHFSRNIFTNSAFYVLTLLRFTALRRRIQREKRFIAQYANLSERYNFQEGIDAIPRADVYISGSDQVFNQNTIYSQLFYLAFAKQSGEKKIAYAPSFGNSSLPDSFLKTITHYLRDFDTLSCRETAGARLLSKITGREIPTVLDPTLLLTAQQWGEMAETPHYKKPYILIYDLNGAENLVLIAQQIKQQTGLHIVCLTNKVQKFYEVDKQIYDAGPAEFVGWIKNAAYVVTDSFHGTVFSLIFHRKFFTYIAMQSTSERLTSILNLLGMTANIMSDVKSEINIKLNGTPDYQSQLDQMIAYSKKILLQAITNKPN